MPDDLTPIDASRDDETALGGRGAAVTLTAVTKTFGELVAVDGIDLTVDSGELLVLLGPSGCGKTTTLRMIAGLEVVDDGAITIGDQDVTQTLPQDRDVSMVFQNYALYPHLTVRENLLFPLGKSELSRAERRARVDDVADLLEIDDHLDKDPDQLSGGQRQRVALGRTIVREPRVFLMDEPLSNLDAKLRVQTRAELRSLQKRLGTTTVYVTHDQEEALSIADRIVIMNDGGIEQIGTPETVYTDPANEFVAGFLGEPSMNFLDVTPGPEATWTVDTADRGDGAVSLVFDAPEATARIGVRPEDIYVTDPDGRPRFTDDIDRLSTPIPVSVGVVEPLGYEYEATVDLHGQTLVLRSEDIDLDPGDRTWIAIDLDRLHTFDSAGETI
ncbi:MAG: ABC transporter ATP-binding protein [Halobacteriaceae archaeon]